MSLGRFSPAERVWRGPAAVTPPKETKEEEHVPAPDLMEPVIGYRVWYVSKEKGRLHSPYYCYDRTRRKNIQDPMPLSPEWGATVTAQCRFVLPGYMHGHGEKEGAPAESCGCGLYAYYDYEALGVHETILMGCFAEPYSKVRGHVMGMRSNGFAGLVVGVVQAWGVIMAHENGFRAEHMKVAALYSPHRRSGEESFVMLRAWAEQYKIPWIMEERNLTGYARLIGDSVPVEWRGVLEEEEYD